MRHKLYYVRLKDPNGGPYWTVFTEARGYHHARLLAKRRRPNMEILSVERFFISPRGQRRLMDEREAQRLHDSH